MGIRVVLADDEAMTRSGFQMMLDGEADIEVVGEARDGREAVDVVRRLNPDVAIVDIVMPSVDGIDATAEIVRQSPSTHVLILTVYDTDDNIYRALCAGASGFIVKNAPADEVVRAIRVVASGDALLCPAVTRRVIDRAVRAGPPETGPPPGYDNLTARERQVYDLVVDGLTNVEIADRIGVSTETVKTHVANILRKVGVRDRVHAVIDAYQHGLVKGDPPD